MKFVEMLKARWSAADTLLCVGTRSRPGSLSRASSRAVTIRSSSSANRSSMRPQTSLCAFKPQIAYFASAGAEDALQRLITYIRAASPAVPVILDAKRGDMASTAEHYAREVFERYNAHAVTLSPYLGFDSIEPYLAYADRGAFLLCRTSNAGGDDLQMLDGRRRALIRARRMAGCGVESRWPAGLGRWRDLSD